MEADIQWCEVWLVEIRALGHSPTPETLPSALIFQQRRDPQRESDPSPGSQRPGFVCFVTFSIIRDLINVFYRVLVSVT